MVLSTILSAYWTSGATRIAIFRAMCWRWRCWAATIEVVVWAVRWAVVWVLAPWYLVSLLPVSVSLLVVLAWWIVV